MDKYLVYMEWDNGQGTDRETFPTLKLAREYAAAELADGHIEECWVEHIEEGIAREDRWGVEIGCATVAHLTRS